MDYKQTLAYLEGSEENSRLSGLDGIKELLEKLGDPQKRMKYIHIAGTNGKGSCAAMTASVLAASGYRTGLFTSPFLSTVNECLQTNGHMIEDDIFAKTLSEIHPLADSMEVRPSRNELMTAAALKWFADEKCEVAVVERVTDGMFDATDIIGTPEVAVVVNICPDRKRTNGGAAPEVAAGLAGVIRDGCETVLYPQSDETEKVIAERCAETGSRLSKADFSLVEAEFDSLEGQAFSYKGNQYALPLPGTCQRKNAAVVIETAETLRRLGYTIEQDSLEHGLYSVFCPGRFELAGEEPDLILDCGHNTQSAAALVENLADYYPGIKHILIAAPETGKDAEALFTVLNLAFDAYICVCPDGCTDSPADYLESCGRKVVRCPDVETAVAEAQDAAGECEGMICTFGSARMCGEIREMLGLR